MNLFKSILAVIAKLIWLPDYNKGGFRDEM